jgi:hypothetical protein
MTKLNVIILFLLFPYTLLGQEKSFEPIQPDTTFKPYIEYQEASGNYILRYVKDINTGRIYETVYAPPTKIDPILEAFVVKENNQFIYKYSLLNGTESKQDIMSFELKLKDQFQNIDLPQNWYHRENRVLPFIRIVHKILERPNWEEGQPIKFDSDLVVLPLNPLSIVFHRSN